MQNNFWQHSKFHIFHVNIQGWLSHSAELTARVRLIDEKPDLICVNETFLNGTVENVFLEGYTVVMRRDRADGRNGGGILALARREIAERITVVLSSEAAERAWLMAHTDRGPHLLGIWYRTPRPG